MLAEINPHNSSPDKAGKYSAIKYTLVITETVYLILLLFIFQATGWSKILARNLGLGLAFYVLIIFLAYYILNFPLNFYHSFILEHQFSLSRQNAQEWFKDQLKSGIISYILSLIVLEVFYFSLRYQPQNWWWIISLFWIFFSFILARLAPVLLIPLFFKYQKISDERLRQRIISLAEKMKVKILDVFQIDFSKKTTKANAALVGWGKTRRVILADTLGEKYSPEEIEVILAHEFSHYKLKHLIKLVLIGALTTILCFYLIFKTSAYVLNFFGLSSLSDIASLPLLFLYFVLFGILMQPWENFLSRRFERNADSLAIKSTGLKEAFISTMNKLANQNLADRNPCPIIKLFFFDHPPIDERINLAKAL
jgi:STE24 endopeptidase